MAKFLLIAAALASGLASLYCVNGILGNAWAASFRDAYYDIYLGRVYICIALSSISFAACVGIVFRLIKSGGGPHGRSGSQRSNH